MSDEIEQRLRDAHHFRFTGDPYGMEAPSLYTEAADEIERLRERANRLEWALLHPTTADAVALRAELSGSSDGGVQ